jgi:SGNH domain-containing protein
MRRGLLVIAAALALLPTPAAARPVDDLFSPRARTDAADVPGDPLDVRAVSFGQHETELWLSVRAAGELPAGRLPGDGVCLTLVRAGVLGRVCIGDADGRGRAEVRYGRGGHGPLRRIPGAVVRGGHTALFASFHPRVVGLPFERVRWFVESRWQGRVDRVPDRGYAAATIGALGEPRCFGAAARAGRRPCRNPALGRTVTPRPANAYVMPDSPCRPLRHRGYSILEPCAFGNLDQPRKPAMALIGDSHSRHFRSALEVVAQAKGWRAVAMTHPGCAFSTEVYPAPDGIPGGCHRHGEEALRWLRAHSSVHTVFTSSSAGRGFSPAGFAAMWNRVPRSVHRIYVIRDVPRVRLTTADCVNRVIRTRGRPWRACAVPRGAAVIADPSAEAAAGARGRVRLIDLTRYFCDPARCFPVIGNVFAYKDDNHINRVFATTLGPYVLRSMPGGRRRARPRSRR